MTDIFCT